MSWSEKQMALLSGVIGLSSHRRCGKSTLLHNLERVVRESLAAGDKIIIVGKELSPDDIHAIRVREQIKAHSDEYDRLMTQPTTRQKRGGRSYTSPYYPDNCKARRGKR